MKKLILSSWLVLLFSAGCGGDYDDSALIGRVDNLENRVVQLEELCRQMNTNITALQKIVEVLQNNDYVKSVTPVMQNGTEVGYTIAFNKSSPITIYHGKNGANGSDGKDGKDGITPLIGVKQHTDGIYYWTLNGEWLTDTDGNKIKAQGTDGTNGADGQDGTNGKDAITPQLKIEGGYWYISYDKGISWTQLGKATGENGQDGTDAVSIFKSVTEDADYIYFTMQDDTVISVPKYRLLSITFSDTEDIRVLADKTYSIGYTITGASDKTVIKALAQDGFRAVVKKTDNATGTIEVTTPSTIQPSEVLIFVTDGNERTIMRSINFVEGVIVITTKSYTVDYNGGTVTVPLSTNIDYTVEIPAADQSWISVAETRAVMRDETLTFTVQPNANTAYRYSTIQLVDALGVESETILIAQKSGISLTLHVPMPGMLEQLISDDEKNLIEELKLTGTLNILDYEYINSMSTLKTLDLSGLSDTSIPPSAFSGNKNLSTILLPKKLKIISDRAFQHSAITSLYLPATVEQIGDYAFFWTKALTGNLVIPDAVTSIGASAFNDSTFDGTLTLGKNVQTIGEGAFANCPNVTGDLIIPDKVTTLGKGVFQSSSFTGKLVIGNSIRSIPDRTFTKCTKLSGTLQIRSAIISIGQYAFEFCAGFTGNLIIPDRVKTIGSCAFAGCTGFKGDLIIGSAVTSIGIYAFTKYDYMTDPTNSDKLNFSKIYCKAQTPPSIASNYTSFGRPSYLGIPIGSKSYYIQTDWKTNFRLIEEVEF